MDPDKRVVLQDQRVLPPSDTYDHCMYYLGECETVPEATPPGRNIPVALDPLLLYNLVLEEK